MSETEKQPLVDLSNPEYMGELTPEQIAEAGKKKKYVDGGVYYGRISGKVELLYSQPKRKTGENTYELNAEAKGAIWLQFTVDPLRKDGTKGTKLPSAQFQKQFLFKRLNKAAMERIGYTPEQIEFVQGLEMPDVYDGLRQFCQALFPDRFLAEFPRWNDALGGMVYQGVKISQEKYKEIANGERDKVLALQNQMQSNPQMISGKEAFWTWFYEPEDKNDPEKGKKGFPSVKFPSATPPKDWKNGGKEFPVLDPDKDFGS